MEKHTLTPNENNHGGNRVFEEVKMGTNKPYSRRFWAAIILMLLILGQVTAVSAHQPGGDFQVGSQTICGLEVHVDPWDYYPIEGSSVPTGRNAIVQVVCTR
jgi:hypothetical protein